MKIDDSIKGLELVLEHYKDRLTSEPKPGEREHYESLFLYNYHELHTLDNGKSKPYIDWWVRYAKW